MQNIVTLGEINEALKFTTVTAAQLAEMGFAALANKPICEALPQEEARRLRTAKLYPAESIGQIRVALAKRLATPASCLHQIQEPTPATALDALREAEAALEVAIARILKSDPGHSISVTSEAKALVAVRAALSATPAADIGNPITGTAAPVAMPEPDGFLESHPFGPIYHRGKPSQIQMICGACPPMYEAGTVLAALANVQAPQAQADARDAEQERWMGIGKAIERACVDLPVGAEIILSLEKDAGTVTLTDKEGDEQENFPTDGGLAGVVNAAIEAAIAAAKGE